LLTDRIVTILAMATVFSGLLWAWVVLRVLRVTQAMRRLPYAAAAVDGEFHPSVSAVLAVRNEGDAIEGTVRSLLDQEGVDIQVVVVDDGSEDDTLARVQALAEGDGRLLVLKNQKLPKGWVAKNYALELGQARAEGDFILFTVADVHHGRRALFNAVAAMERERLDHVALVPRLEANTFWESVLLPLFMILTQSGQFDPKAADPESGVGAGVGAFNMVRAESYRLRGTHARIRNAIADDRALAEMMRDENGRGTLFRAVGQVRMRPSRSTEELKSQVSRGVLAATGQSAVLTGLLGMVFLLATWIPLGMAIAFLPLALNGLLSWLWTPAFLAVALPVVGILRIRSMVRASPIFALLYPIGNVVLAVAAFSAALRFAMSGQVTWRGRLYSRRDLEEPEL
jgi:cellulose synthase/poly-beta-1,6-N-acetylglucosamine synthase-like glycosyltransferase